MVIALISWIVFGLVVGLVARALYPGHQPMGFVATTGLGIAGSFIGGMVANVLTGMPVFQAHAAGFIGSLFGALVFLGLASFARRQSHA